MTALSSLSFNRLQLSVFLGVYPEERLHPQTVSIDARIHFRKPPLGCYSDQLDDTYCYSELLGFLKEKVATTHFQLLENFTLKLYELLKSYFPTDVTLAVRVTKRPALPELTEGIAFEYGDGLTQW